MKIWEFSSTLFTVILCALSAGPNVMAADPVVTIQTGKVRGVTMFSTKNREFYAFRGIPYAEAPVGHLRFKDPVPKAPWTGEFDATKDSDRCAGIDRGIITMSGTEDCLKINVYTPKFSSSGPSATLPVYVFIYGGGFTGGTASSQMYGPKRLMNKDIVLVIPYYRVGPLGFLNTKDGAAPGNAGLHDQNLALVWVQKNIAFFGGDPKRVTLGGQSAGSASVSYHLLSPLSTGLFRAAIMESGNALGPWAHEEDPLWNAIELGTSVGCHYLNTTKLVQCLQTKSAEEIVLSPFRLWAASRSFLGFVPSVEKRTSGAMVVDKPEKLLIAGRFNKVPVITGVNLDEVMIVAAAAKTVAEMIVDDLVLSLPRVLSKITNQNLTVISPSSPLPNFFQEINFLFPVYAATSIMSDVTGDIYFSAPNDKFIRLLAKHNVPLYSYVFAYKGDSSPIFGGVKVVPHAYELAYLFNMPEFQLSGKDEMMSDTLVGLWTNFITNLDPTPSQITIPKWTRTYSTLYPPYLYFATNYFGQPYCIMKYLGYRSLQAFFWNNLLPSFTLP